MSNSSISTFSFKLHAFDFLQVVVYRPVDGSAQFADAVTIIPSGSTQQLGSYYGGVLLSTDVNNDGRDDLFVGAPLYIVQNGSNYDDGRVFAYISSPSGSSLQLWVKLFLLTIKFALLHHFAWYCLVLLVLY